MSDANEESGYTQMLGITTSQFYAQAAQRYLEHLDAESLTRQIDAAIAVIGPDESSDVASAAGRRVLVPTAEDDW